MTIDDPENPRRAERFYIRLQLFSHTFCVWCLLMFAPLLVGLIICVIITLFLAIRYTQLPLLLYIWCLVTGITILFVIFWISYDIVLVKRTAEDVMSRFASHDGAPYLGRMSKQERVAVAKRALALKVLEFPNGDSVDLSLDLPVMVWEEVLNQVLFLLSL